MRIFKLVKEIKSKEGKLHFRRWRILSTRFFNIYFHGIYHHDEDEHEHDHPFSFVSCILVGGYIERSNGKLIKAKAFSVRYSHYSRFHSIHQLLKVPTYTLMFTGPRKDAWGYNTEKGWIDHFSYRTAKNNKHPK